nr:immunoglobulin light chain junction region [Macaca mulatta]MOW32005.1 immunoglobulin light chain junction region [Macaca mulatta]
DYYCQSYDNSRWVF